VTAGYGSASQQLFRSQRSRLRSARRAEAESEGCRTEARAHRRAGSKS